MCSILGWHGLGLMWFVELCMCSLHVCLDDAYFDDVSLLWMCECICVWFDLHYALSVCVMLHYMDVCWTDVYGEWMHVMMWICLGLLQHVDYDELYACLSYYSVLL